MNLIWHFGGKYHYPDQEEDDGTMRRDERLGMGFRPEHSVAVVFAFGYMLVDTCTLSHVTRHMYIVTDMSKV